MNNKYTVEDKITEYPAFRWGVSFLGLCIAFFILDFSKSGYGSLFLVISDSVRFISAFFTTAIILLSLYYLKRFSFRTQVIIFWIILGVGAIMAFSTFDLSVAFIQKKIYFLIVQGAITTIYISFLAIVLATILALLTALGKMSNNPLFYAISSFYISYFRGTPLLVQVYILYLGLPQLGFVIDAVPAGVIALSLCYGAYMAEIFRAGIMSIPYGQNESGYSLGLSKIDVIRYIILPQSLRVIVPPTGNQFIAMLKDSSLVSVLGVWELMFLARTQGRAEFKHLEMLVTAALVYWFISIIFEVIQAKLERHYGQSIVR